MSTWLPCAGFNECIQWASDNPVLVWVLVSMGISLLVSQGIKWFVRGAFKHLASFWRTVIVWVAAFLSAFYISQYLLSGKTELYKEIAVSIALTHVVLYQITVSIAIKYNLGWLLRLLKLRTVRASNGDEKVVDGDDMTVQYDRPERRKND